MTLKMVKRTSEQWQPPLLIWVAKDFSSYINLYIIFEGTSYLFERTVGPKM